MTDDARDDYLFDLSLLGADHEAEAAALTHSVLKLAAEAAGEQIAPRTTQALSRISRLKPFDDNELLSGETSALARGASVRVADLQIISHRVAPLDDSLTADLSKLKLRRSSSADNYAHQDAIASANFRALLDRRIVHLEAARQSLERCRILIAETLSTARRQQDQLAMMNDVAAPIAVRNANLSALASNVAEACLVSKEADLLWGSILQKDMNRLGASEASAHSAKVHSGTGNQLAKLGAWMLNSISKAQP